MEGRYLGAESAWARKVRGEEEPVKSGDALRDTLCSEPALITFPLRQAWEFGIIIPSRKPSFGHFYEKGSNVVKKIMRTWCKAGVVFPVLLLFCATAAWRVSADDLILEPGQSHTVTGTESYGRVFVNGDLTVGAGAKLTVEKRSVSPPTSLARRTWSLRKTPC